MSVFEKIESRAKNLEELQRQKQQLIKKLQYQNQQLTFYLLIELLNKISLNDNLHILTIYELFKLIIDFSNFVTKKNKLIREKLKLIFAIEFAKTK